MACKRLISENETRVGQGGRASYIGQISVCFDPVAFDAVLIKVSPISDLTENHDGLR